MQKYYEIVSEGKVNEKCSNIEGGGRLIKLEWGNNSGELTKNKRLFETLTAARNTKIKRGGISIFLNHTKFPFSI